MDIRTKILTDQDEIAEVIGICAEAFHDQRCNDPAVIQEFSEKFSVRACFVAACTEDEVVGFAAFYCNDTVNFTAFISMIVVRSIYHLRGGGTKILGKVKKICRDNGMKRIRLEVADDNLQALSFYRRRGFVLEGASGRGSSFYVLNL